MTKTWAKIVVLVTSVAVTSLSARPAHAAIDVNKIVEALKVAYDIYKKLDGKELSLDDATTKIMKAIESAKTDIIDHMDVLKNADAEACTKDVIRHSANLKGMTQTEVRDLAYEALACMDLLETLIPKYQSKEAIDMAGLALNALTPVALIIQKRAEFWPNVRTIANIARNSNNSIIQLLEPSCSENWLHGDSSGKIMEVVVTCTAYNGDKGVESTFVPGGNVPLAHKNAGNMATRSTSRKVAQTVLPLLPVGGFRL